MKIIPNNFGSWSESDLNLLSPKEFRMQEAFYFYEMFRVSCGKQPHRLQQAPAENQFLWITYADTFLAMLVSVEEFVDRTIKSRLLASDLYRFIKQLRNITVHYTVLGGRRHAYGAAPLVNRIYNISFGGNGNDSVDPKINFDRIRRLLSRIKSNGNNSHHVAGSRRFLNSWKRKGNEYVVLYEIFEEAIEFVGKECGITLAEP